MKDWPKLVASILLCELVGITGAVFTVPAISAWYVNLNKPFFSPPNWIFSPVWTILYLMMGISLFLVWQKGFKRKGIKEAVFYFGVQLFFNFVWSIVFFGLRSPVLGLADIVAMWITIVITIKHFYPLSKMAAYLLIPYLLWVSFATVLNGAIMVLN